MKEIIDFLGLKILRADKLEEVKGADLETVEVVEVREKSEGGFWRPAKISWRMKIGTSELVGQIKSKRARKQIKADGKRLPSLGVHLETIFPLTENSFLAWLKIYRKQIGEKERGRQVISEDWLKVKAAEGKRVGGVFAFRGKEMIGGNLFLLMKNRVSVAYGVAERVDELQGGLGLLLDFESMKWAKANGYSEISLGQDTNLYGFHLSPGLLSYKAKLGFRPEVSKNTEWFTTYFLNWDKFGPTVIFDALLETGEEGFVCLTETGEPPETVVPLNTAVKYYRQEEIRAKHAELLPKS